MFSGTEHAFNNLKIYARFDEFYQSSSAQDRQCDLRQQWTTSTSRTILKTSEGFGRRETPIFLDDTLERSFLS